MSIFPDFDLIMSDQSISTPFNTGDSMCSSGGVAPMALFPDSTSSVTSSSESALPPSTSVAGAATSVISALPVARSSNSSDSVVSINIDTKLLTLEERCNLETARVWIRQCSHPQFGGLNFVEYISPSGKLWIDMKMSANTTLPRNTNGIVEWRTFTREKFCESLLEVLSDKTTGLVIDKPSIDQDKIFKVVFEMKTLQSEDETCFQLRLLQDQFPFAAAEELALCYAMLVKKLPEKWKALFESPPAIHPNTNRALKTADLCDFTENLQQMCRVGRNFFRIAESFGAEIAYGPETRCSSIDGTRTAQKRPAPTDDSSGSNPPSKQNHLKRPVRSVPSDFVCWGCGSLGHPPQGCPLREHADFNHENCAWTKSPKGLLWKEKGYDTLPATRTLGFKSQGKTPSGSSKTPSGSSKTPFTKKGAVENILSSLSSISSSQLLLCCVSLSAQISTGQSNEMLETLMDTGSLAGNFISESAVSRSGLSSGIGVDFKTVCSGLDNNCITLDKSIDLFVFLPCEINLKESRPFHLKFFFYLAHLSI